MVGDDNYSRLTAILNRLVDSLTRLAGDRLELAGRRVGARVSDALAAAGVFAAAGAVGLLALVFGAIAAADWLAELGFAPAAARGLVAAGLALLAGAMTLVGLALRRRADPPAAVETEARPPTLPPSEVVADPALRSP